MFENEFYVYLPSEVSVDPREYNTLTRYRTSLPIPLDLKGDWEVALVELIYTKSWFNFAKSEIISFLFYDYADDDNFKQKEFDFRRHGLVRAGHYTAEQLIQEVDIAMRLMGLPDTMTPPRLFYDKFTNKVRVAPGTHSTDQNFRIIPKFGPELCEVLGLDQNLEFLTALVKNKKHMGSRVVDLDGVRRSLFVYTDIIRPVFVGNTCAPLLRVVPVNQKATLGQQIGTTFNTPYYFPVSRSHISSIEITLRDITGDIIPFRSGRVVTTLHFRRK